VVSVITWILRTAWTRRWITEGVNLFKVQQIYLYLFERLSIASRLYLVPVLAPIPLFHTKPDQFTHLSPTLSLRHIAALQKPPSGCTTGIARSKRDGTRAETRFGLTAKRTSPFKSAGVSVQSTTGSRGVRISRQQLYRPCSDVQCKAAGYPLHSHLSPSLPLPCVTVCHQVLNALYSSTPRSIRWVTRCTIQLKEQ